MTTTPTTTSLRNLDWLRGRVARHLVCDVTQADDAFAGPQSNPWQFIDDGINEAYKIIILDAAQGVDPDFFKVSDTITWKGSQLSYKLPPGLNRVTEMSILDITGGLPGRQITPTAGYNFSQEVYWTTLDTLNWGNSGPDADAILLITHRAVPQDLVMSDDEPRLLPWEYRDLLHWKAAAVTLMERLGDDVPQRIDEHITEWTWKFHTALANAPTDSGSYTSEPTPVLPTILP